MDVTMLPWLFWKKNSLKHNPKVEMCFIIMSLWCSWAFRSLCSLKDELNNEYQLREVFLCICFNFQISNNSIGKMTWTLKHGMIEITGQTFFKIQVIWRNGDVWLLSVLRRQRRVVYRRRGGEDMTERPKRSEVMRSERWMQSWGKTGTDCLKGNVDGKWKQRLQSCQRGPDSAASPALGFGGSICTYNSPSSLPPGYLP